jgi:hypothetical protein
VPRETRPIQQLHALVMTGSAAFADDDTGAAGAVRSIQISLQCAFRQLRLKIEEHDVL